ncbi:MAG: hypothetical protein FJZ01_19395 [Candidatus Sericytochromatia bacterium]|nr:hypothetical protein [Candidatus Tanganyikabacteria bacterium]
MPPIDLSRLTPEYLGSLSEAQQEALLEELKAELGKVQAHVKGQQREAIKRLQRGVARHEAQLAWFTAQARQIDETLAKVDPAVDAPELRAAVRTLKLGQAFYRSGRKLLAIQMQDMRQDLAAIATEITGPFEIGDPFSTYEYQRANAECDLAATQLMMIENARSHRIVSAALGVPTEPATAEEPAGGATALLERPVASRTIRPDAGPRTKQFGPSAIGLVEGLPPPEDLPPTTVIVEEEPTEEGAPADADAGAGEGASDDAPAPESSDAPASPEAAQEAEQVVPAADAAPEAPGTATLLDENEEKDAAFLQKAFAGDDELKRRAALIADQLREASGLIAKCLTYMGHIATSPPAEGIKLLESHLWKKLDGKAYYLRRLPDQVADSQILSRLFPRTEKPTLPFERQMPEAATRPIAGLPTDRLGLDD